MTAYTDEILSRPCKRCSAPEGYRCKNVITGKYSRIPCLERLKEKAA